MARPDRGFYGPDDRLPVIDGSRADRWSDGARPTRRQVLTGGLALGLGLRGVRGQVIATRPSTARGPALIAITLDLEMSRGFPTAEQTHWDFHKGDLDQATRDYAVRAAARVKARGGLIHCFVVGQTLEHENVDWLSEIVRVGHMAGNHTYDHVNVKATQPSEIQPRFERAPWLLQGKTPAEVIADNIRLDSEAIRARLKVEPAGFRDAGGFANGLSDRPDLQRMLQELGFTWVSTRYPAPPMGPAGKPPSPAIIDGIVEAQAVPPSLSFIRPGWSKSP